MSRKGLYNFFVFFLAALFLLGACSQVEIRARGQAQVEVGVGGRN